MTQAADTALAYPFRYYMVVCLLALCAFFLPSQLPSAAAYDGITGMHFGQGFSCSGGSASGDLYTAQSCDGDPSQGQVFSYFVCNFEKIIREALGNVYCSIVDESRPGVMAALTMAVLFMGMMFLMGMSPFTAKELMVFAAKFSMVLAFATEAEYMIGIGYALFMNVAKEGIVIVLSYLFEGHYSNANDVYKLFDDGLKQIMGLSSQDSKQDNSQCSNTLFSMMVLIAAAFPPLAFVGAYFMIKLVWVMLRAVFGYCQGILGVTFLVTLAPIYVSFALFKPTRSLFEKWTQYLISFSFQMVIVFAFLGMAFNIIKKMADDITDYTKLVKPYNRDFVASGTSNVLQMCGICEMDKTAPKEKPKCKSDRVMEIGELAKDENFLHFASVKILGMVLMFYILDIMMDFVPQMARHLAGQKYAGQLGGGEASPEVEMAIPGEKNIKQALQAGAQAFLSGGNSATGFVRGLKAAGGTFMKGVADEAMQTAGGAAGAAAMYGLMRGGGPGSGKQAGFTPTGNQSSAAASGGEDSGGPKVVRSASMGGSGGSSGGGSGSDRGGGGDGDDGPDNAATRRASYAPSAARSDTSSSAALAAQQIVAGLTAMRPVRPPAPVKAPPKEGEQPEMDTGDSYFDDSYDVVGALEYSISQLAGMDPQALSDALSAASLDPSLTGAESAAIRARVVQVAGLVGGGMGGGTTDA